MAKASKNSFDVRQSLSAGGRSFDYFDLLALEKKYPGRVNRLPFSMKILLENLLRHEDGEAVRAEDIEALVHWSPTQASDREIAFMPARVLMQDFTGVPAVVDLAVMRDAMEAMDRDPKKINPLIPAELVIDHSVQVDAYGTAQAFGINVEKEFERNQERYRFLRWGQAAFNNFAVVPPGTGICHQVNLEYLARVVFDNGEMAYPDTLVGTDSHTTMVNGLGVLGWGVGGIEAEAAMLGQPITMLIPQVVGFRLTGSLREGVTATDLVLTVTEMLRKKGVVAKFVEFYGDGLKNLTLADRATIANMAPEYGATCGIFPVDQETLNYLKFSGRNAQRIALVEAYARAQGMFHGIGQSDVEFSDSLELQLKDVEPSLAGPRRPQDRVVLGKVGESFAKALPELRKKSKSGEILIDKPISVTANGSTFDLSSGAVVIAAITSCTNTSNPTVLIGAGLLAKNAVEAGLTQKPWVKTSLAPGSQVVTEYLTKSGLLAYLEKLGFGVVGYGCTTCIGNSGPLPEPVSKAIETGNLIVGAVLSGNRNFEGRIHPDVRANYLASPPLVVAYALAGRIDLDLQTTPLGKNTQGKEIFLRDIWPTQKQIQETIQRCVTTDMFVRKYGEVFKGDAHWQSLESAISNRFKWDVASTYVRKPPYFEAMPKTPPALKDITGARMLAMLGDSITTDHISPAGSIKKDSPAGVYLMAHGVKPEDFNSYGSRRGNHEVMMRGTFANVRLRNELAPNTEGGWTRHFPDGKQMTIYDASVQYRNENTPLIVVAGKEYGSGSSRDWAAKGVYMLGIRAVIAESYERIHRSNLIGMGVLPLQFAKGQSRQSLNLSGEEVFSISGITTLEPMKSLSVTATAANGESKTFDVLARIDTPVELKYYQNGGILHYVLRSLAKG